MDADRLVFPPLFSLGIAIPVSLMSTHDLSYVVTHKLSQFVKNRVHLHMIFAVGFLVFVSIDFLEECTKIEEFYLRLLDTMIVQVWYLLQVIIPSPALHSSVFGGMLMGYILYDLTHYFLHFGTAFTERLYKMKVCY